MCTIYDTIGTALHCAKYTIFNCNTKHTSNATTAAVTASSADLLSRSTVTA